MDATDLGNPLKMCPYDESHRILKSRFTAHLLHCRNNNTKLKKRNAKICPYDFLHVVEAADYESHLETCPKRPKPLEDIDDQIHIGSVPLEELKKVYVPPAQENWDDDPLAQTYDPLQQAKSRGVLLTPVGLSSAKKRAFRKAERQRFLNLEGSGGRAEKFSKYMKEKTYKPPYRLCQNVSTSRPSIPTTNREDNYKCATMQSIKNRSEYDKAETSMLGSDDEEEPEFPLRPPRTKSLALSISCNANFPDDVSDTSRISNMEKDLIRIFKSFLD